MNSSDNIHRGLLCVLQLHSLYRRVWPISWYVNSWSSFSFIAAKRLCFHYKIESESCFFCLFVVSFFPQMKFNLYRNSFYFHLCGHFAIYIGIPIIYICADICPHKWNSIYIETPLIFISADIFHFLRKCLPGLSKKKIPLDFIFDFWFFFRQSGYPQIFRILSKNLEFIQ